jgi:DNA invertase Pin-like site-specific DNA recombinase
MLMVSQEVTMSARRLLDQRRAVALTRVSTDEKRQELGAEAQRRAITAWAEANGVEIVAWFSDEVSGTCDVESRPGLVAAVAAMGAQDAGTLIVQKLDRLARNPLVAEITKRDVNKMGGRIVAADGIGNGGTPADELIRSVVGAVAEYEAAVIRQRIKAALAVKRDRGERLGGAPYGYRAEGAKGERRLVEHPEEQAVLAAIRELRGQGLTVRAIATELERRGVLGRVWKGERRPLTPQAVHGLLKAAGCSSAA